MSSPIDIQNKNPLYLQVIDAIKGRISQNFWHIGMMIPSENELSKELGVSVGTVKKAFGILVQEGVLFRRQGKGTFVAGPDFSKSFSRFFRYGTTADGSSGLPGSVILNIKTTLPDKRGADMLRLGKNEKVLKIERLRTLGKIPIVLEDIIIPYALFKGFENLPLEDKLLYPIYDEQFSTPIIWADEFLQPDTADTHTAKMLNIEPKAPVIKVERIAYTYADAPVECRFSLGRGDQFRYHIIVR